MTDTDFQHNYLLENEVVFLPEERVLLAKNSNRIELTENNYRMLCCLLEGEVSKKKLMEKIWSEQNGAVSDSCYYGQVHLLRKALIMAGISGDVIKTIPRKGLKYNGVYAFCAPEHLEDRCREIEMEHIHQQSINPRNDTFYDPEDLKRKIKKISRIFVVSMTIASVCWLTTLLFIIF
ncbi:hypothetical protein LWW59_004640, partial [Salmonella enterica]|nr:hypothetical protein [Salmonella enterica]EIR3324516.1 hypothetical protein [Salmonella enterica]EIU1699242.1 hypothetical protein [Salmonella enterica]EJI2370174.1 hypothetical protein [Salmonella enterica]